MKEKFLINSEKWLAKERLLAGVMTGTSVDAVDVALLSLSKIERDVSMKLRGFIEHPIPEEIREALFRIITSKTSTSEISKLHFVLSHLYCDAIKKCCNESGIDIEELDAAAIHGQTVFHQPQSEILGGYNVSSTFQLGSPSALSKLLQKPVIGDFRSADIALGGQGAPLVPIFDKYFLRSDEESRIALNIGGIANITYLPKEKSDAIIAYDTGPGNCLIDLLTKKYFDKKYDRNGELAEKGQVIPELLKVLMNEPYIQNSPPKSTGRELFNFEYLQNALNASNITPAADNFHSILRTVTEFTADSIAQNIKQHAADVSKIIASGGGTKNILLMKLLQEKLSDKHILSSTDFGIPSDAKEAMCFAFLGWLTIGDIPGNILTVTGASRETVLGVVAL